MAFACLAFLGVGCGARGDAGVATDEATAQPTLDAATLDAAIAAATDYIVRHTDADGRFTYVLRANGRRRGGKYNVLRHAGTIYALGEAHRSSGGEAAKDAIARAARYLLRRHVDRFEKAGDDAVAVWSLPGEELKRAERAVKLGGSGLGLVALCAAREIDPQSVSLTTLRGLAKTIEFLQRPDGSFASKYIEGRGIDKRFVSLYYPGEAVLGLVRLAELDPNARWVELAGRAIGSLMATRKDIDDDDLPADHWLLIAVGELSALVAANPVYAEPLRESVGSVSAMQTHAIRIADKMLAEQRDAASRGAFGGDRRSTPTATRLEGLLALLSSLPADHPARPRLRAAASAGVRFLLDCQVGGQGPRRGGLTRGCKGGARDRRSDEIRIDYVQHALSAYIGARAQLLN